MNNVQLVFRCLSLFCVICISSCKKDNSILVAGTITEPDSTTIQMKITSDSNWVYSMSGPYHIQRPTYGKVIISNDTIYFKNSRRFKSAVLKNGYLDFLDGEMRLPIVENRTSIRKFELNGPEDYIFFSTNSSVDLNANQIKRLQKIIDHAFRKNVFKLEKAKESSDYYKQCIGFLDQEGTLKININCCAKKVTSIKEAQSFIQDPCDGGEYYIEFEVDLQEGSILAIHVHGEA